LKTQNTYISIFVLLLLGILSAGSVKAQRSFDPPNLPKYDMQPYHFGFQISVNQMFFTINTVEDMAKIVVPYSNEMFPDIQPYSENGSQVLYLRSGSVYGLESIPRLGFTISIVGNLRLANYFDLRFIPSLAFGERLLIYDLNLNYATSPTLVNPDVSRIVTMRKAVTSTFLEFPFYVKYKAMRLKNFSPYVIAGGKYAIDLASEAKKNKDEINNKHIKLYRSDIYGELGVGFDFYNNWFKLGVELKMSYGVRDMLRREDNIYTDVIDALNSKVFTLGVTFE
jgi:hypothetical protein